MSSGEASPELNGGGVPHSWQSHDSDRMRLYYPGSYFPPNHLLQGDNNIFYPEDGGEDDIAITENEFLAEVVPPESIVTIGSTPFLLFSAFQYSLGV